MGKRARLAAALAGASVITIVVAWATMSLIDALALDQPAAFFTFGLGALVWAFALHRLGVGLSRNDRR